VCGRQQQQRKTQRGTAYHSTAREESRNRSKQVGRAASQQLCWCVS
jgi:hypothetical protein